MTDVKHTPGPWEFGPGYAPGDSTFELFAPGGRQVIAQCSYENMWLSTYDGETDAANARLIASAPDLLEALKRMVEIDDDEVVMDTDSVKERLSAARAAIARATGEAA
jgi:hypothetical protein